MQKLSPPMIAPGGRPTAMNGTRGGGGHECDIYDTLRWNAGRGGGGGERPSSYTDGRVDGALKEMSVLNILNRMYFEKLPNEVISAFLYLNSM